MAIIKSSMFSGSQPVDTPVPHRSGETITVIFSYTFSTTLAIGDIVELYPVFGHGKIVGFDFETENVGAIAIDIGLMSGEAGSNDQARTCGAQLISNVAANAAVASRSSSILQLTALQGGVGDKNVSIGVKALAELVAGATKKIHIRAKIAA
jgi:hypothetical protein